MFKKILFYSVVLLISAYLITALTAFNKKPVGETCSDLELVIRDSVYAGFITKKEVTNILQKQGLNPIGKELDAVCTQKMEELLSQHSLIDQVECYKVPNGKIHVEVSQRIPILRIMNNRGENYFVDNKGIIMPSDAKCVARLAIVTGNVEKSFATRELYKFALFLQHNSFWNAQIEQINVLKNNNVELVPRVGNHIIYLGKLTDYEKKLARVKTFYEKGLNRVGWNKYSRINVEFSNQVICTKK